MYMVSRRSIRNFLVINSGLLLISAMFYGLNEQMIFLLPLFMLLRNLLLVWIVSLSDKPLIVKKHAAVSISKFDLCQTLATTTLVESGTYLLMNAFSTSTSTSSSLTLTVMLFPLKSFVFEIVFDFGHYWMHRLAHYNRTICKYHNKHHKNVMLTPIMTFYQDPFDLIISNFLPVLFALVMTRNMCIYFSSFEMCLLNCYKVIIEITGHSGKYSNPASSFLQFPWLPKLLNIELYSEDHATHHIILKGNYAKRFSLWDKVFGTYHQPLALTYNL